MSRFTKFYEIYGYCKYNYILVDLFLFFVFFMFFVPVYFFFFFFNDTATPEIYTLSLHDALPICRVRLLGRWWADHRWPHEPGAIAVDRGNQLHVEQVATAQLVIAEQTVQRSGAPEIGRAHV